MTRQPTPSILDDVLTTDASRTTQLYAGNIKRDGGTQMRADLDPATVQEYADAMAEAGGWRNFPPVITYHDGTDNWLADGFHRLAAYLSRFSASGMIPADVRSGTRRDAILHAAGANASHGLRRTNADKRRAVETLLRDEEWAKWSNMEIARRCSVDEKTVRNVRGDLERTSEIPKSDQRHGADGRITNTANIGAKPGPAVQPIPQPTAREYSAAVQASQPAPVTVDAEPSDAPLPSWADEPESISKPWQTVADYLIYRDQARADGMAVMNIREWREWLDEQAAAAAIDPRIPAARALINLYREVIATENQYGALTGQFSDWLAPKRELHAMIGHLEHLITIIQHPQEAA